MTSIVQAPAAATETADEPSDETSETADHRLQELGTAVSRLAGNARSIDTGKVLFRVGAVVTPLGLLLIVLGYWGAAHAARPIEQTPYLISGGLLGLALVFAGAFAYFAHWLTRGVAQQQRMVEVLVEHTEHLDERFAKLEELLAARPGSAPARPGGGTNGHGDAALLLATPTGTTAHKPECPVVATRTDAHPVAAAEGMGRCKICRPAIGA